MVEGERGVGIELSPRGTKSQLHRVQAVQIVGCTNLCNCKNGKLPICEGKSILNAASSSVSEMLWR